MAVKRLPSGSYQARLKDCFGTVLTKTFPSKLQAEEQVVHWKKQKNDSTLKSQNVRNITLDDFFVEWFEGIVSTSNQSGWRKTQLQHYRDFVSPLIGKKRLSEIRPRLIQQVMNAMAERKKSSQLRLHVFGLLRKMYTDAIETYEYASFNPVLRSLRPKVPIKEARYLNKHQATLLLSHVENRKYGLAIWLQLYLGLRLGELQGLRWEDIDLHTGRLVVRRVYIRKTEVFRDYPKSGQQRTHSLPVELLERLKVESRKSELVVSSPLGNVLPYRWYAKQLNGYCSQLKIPRICTHGLRHSTSELYVSFGASRDDIRQLLGHSSVRTTERYMHIKNQRLEQVSNVIRMFPAKGNTKGEHAGKSA